MSTNKSRMLSRDIPGGNVYQPSRHNSDACFIPESVRQYKDEPLYILVAWWCLQQQDWVHRLQISEAFQIPPSRASYLMAYLRNKTKRVLHESREALLSNNVYRYEIHVTRVMPPVPRKSSTALNHASRNNRKSRRVNTDEINLLWNQISRRYSDKTNHQEDNDDD